MTETYGSTPVADDIDDTFDSPSADLERRADALLSASEIPVEGRAFGTSARDTGSIRQALRQDAEQGRLWMHDRAGRVSEVIRDEPVKATAYALIAGVFLGVLLRR